MTASFKRNMRERLTSLEQEIRQSIEEQHQEYAELTLGDRTEDTDEASIRNEERALAAILHHDERRLLRVHSALGRLDAGHYGVCAMCGDMIDDDRLAAQPETVFCYSCAQKRERAAHGAHLN
ncbi:MAG: TraR/DksA family transcriptional regulator [Spirochaetota bacterium]